MRRARIPGAAGVDPAIGSVLDLARTATVVDVRRAVRRVASGDGTARVDAVLTHVEAAELVAALGSLMDTSTGVSRGEESTRADGPPAALAAPTR
ncbi:hypothetical protein GHK86_12050 [Acidimicrobiaceae bacterium USS-CC1]|uniref:Uncharacterized protein n=1 Tax=Acidiferrimicrobium australe TaxID=2664430 RepID=A0ABW9QVI4_9ACTN|nr:hypothetical protein [Acidiferrimicrobium australe]